MSEVTIRRYEAADEPAFFAMLEAAGDDWREYVGPQGRESYARAMRTSVAYLLSVEGALCGYARCREDDGFGVYVYDLLVLAPQRGRGLGRRLMERVCADAAGQTVYVMSDVDPYYEKLGYDRAGSIFVVTPGAPGR